MQTKTRGMTGKKAALGIVCLLAILGWFGYSWWQTLNEVPKVSIPTPMMPSPNARDYYIKAGNALVDSDKIGSALPSRRRFGAVLPQPKVSLAEKAALVR